MAPEEKSCSHSLHPRALGPFSYPGPRPLGTRKISAQAFELDSIFCGKPIQRAEDKHDMLAGAQAGAPVQEAYCVMFFSE